MNAEIMAVGTELLLGDILNTNAQYLSKQLANLGIGVYFQTVVGDNPDRLCAAYAGAFERADMVIATGGLGPTKDDLTKEMAARYLKKELVMHGPSLEKMTAYMTKQGFAMTESNRKQALVIEGSDPLPNDHGTAPGCLYEADGKILVLLPGPPREMTPMFESYVLPFLKTKTDRVFVSKTLRVCGIGESLAEAMLKDIIESQTNPTIAPYAKTSEVHFRVTASAENEEAAKALMRPTVERVYGVLGRNIYGEDDTALEDAVAKLLIKQGKKIALAESCTGGMLTARLVNYPGVSETLLEAAVTYSNEAKVKRLGVKAETLEQFGAVSEQTAAEMAEGIARTSGADVGVGITGVAGPDGGSDEKPVGTVYIGVWNEGAALVKHIRIIGDRERVRSRAVTTALDFLRRRLLNID